MFIDYNDIDINNKFDDLCITLNKQKNQKELKSSFIIKKDFLTLIKSVKLNYILKFINDNNLYLHYSIRNNLYLFLADIIDDSFNTYEEEYKEYNDILYADYSRELKSLLYMIVISNIDAFIDFFNRFNYPDININDISNFADELSFLVEENISNIDITYYYAKYNDNCILELCYNTIIRLLKCVKKTGNLLYLTHNEYIKENGDPFYEMYLDKIRLYEKSVHIFDNEKYIIKYINDIYPDYKNKYNFSFVDSINNPMIQISDIISNFIYKFTEFTNKTNISKLPEIIDEIKNNDIALENMKIFSKLVNKSTTFSKGLIYYIFSDYEIYKFEQIFHYFI